MKGQLSLAAGMRNVDPTTQYLFLNIDMEVTDPTDRASLRGVGCRLAVEEISERAELHNEDTAESYAAKFRMNSRSVMCTLGGRPMVEIVVHVNMLHRGTKPGSYWTQRFMKGVAHTSIHDPYTGSTAGMMAQHGEEKGRAGYWDTAMASLDKVVTSYVHTKDR